MYIGLRISAILYARADSCIVCCSGMKPSTTTSRQCRVRGKTVAHGEREFSSFGYSYLHTRRRTVEEGEPVGDRSSTSDSETG
jgi:hypothetical protein